MYDREIVAEMSHNHRALLKRYDDSLERLGVFLTEQPFPQSLQNHILLHLATRFHKSALALRLLLVSGYCGEAYGVLRMMTEFAAILKDIPEQPGESVLRWIEDGGHSPDRMLRARAEEAHLQEGLGSVRRACSSSSFPQPDINPEELILPVGPVPFNAEGMLEQACWLAAAIQGYVADAEAEHAKPLVTTDE
ncbi:hypothetical protein [Paenibacillus sp. S150]|uniref:hypothetical protein n=1 Tax=Paenibacillus sp. S150 TaxID=2749826 RepID=UPI001C585C6D|nr:hypothetical protein [Paenibacillus sp. S150]MBW4082636.1 hypothetical protein [Paenibacillus sp. S150]